MYLSLVKTHLLAAFLYTYLICKELNCTDTPQITPYPNAVATEFASLTFTCSYNGTGIASYIKWNKNNSRQAFIKTDDCGNVGEFNATLYNYSCVSKNVFSLTLSRVTEEQHGSKWNCEVLVNAIFIKGHETVLSVNVPVQSVTFSHPSGSLITVVENESVQFECITSEERPRSTILWYIDGDSNFLPESSVKPTSNDLRQETKGILKHKFSRNDNGTMVFCSANNIPSGTPKESKRKEIIVQYLPNGPPVIYSFSNRSIYKLIEFTSQILYCSVSGGNPLPVLTWNCNNGTVTLESSDKFTVNKSINWTATAQQSQNCICSSEHPLSGIQSSLLLVQILYPPNKPSIYINGSSLTTVKIIQGRNISVGCNSTSNPNPSYEWSSMRLLHPILLKQFILVNINASETENYTCTAKNKMVASNGLIQQENQSANIYIDVLHPPSVPELMYSGMKVSYNLSVLCGDNVSLSCESDGNPTPTYKWNGNNSNPLELMNIQSSSTGIYWCTSENTMIPTFGAWETEQRSSQIHIDVMYAPAKPSFYVNGDSVNAVIVVQDRNITVRCAAKSNPSPSYSWASPYRTFSDASSSFSLINANVRNAGNYTCTAKNYMVASNGRRQNGSNSADISLSVQYPPSSPKLLYKGTEIIEKIEVVLGDNIFVNCTSDGNPSPNVTWADQTGATIAFQPILLSDEGNYTCKSENTLTPTGGPTETKTVLKDMSIEVLFGPGQPRFLYNESANNDTEIWSSVRVIEGKSSEIFCLDADGKPTPSYFWSGNKTSQTGVLTFYNITRRYSGTYICHAKNTLVPTVGASKTMYFNRTLEINVLYPPVVADMADEVIQAGSTLNFPCFADSNPAATFRWARLNQSLNISYDNILNIPNIQPNDSGIYTCIAENTMNPTREKETHNTAFNHLEVIVLYLPEQVKNFRHVMSTSTTAMISWISGSNGGRLQTFYIEFKQLSDGIWLFDSSQETDNNNRQHNFTLTGLKPGTAYEARIVSGNVIGNNSHPETISFTTKKEISGPDEEEIATSPVTVALTVCAGLILILVVAAIVIIRRKGFMKRFLSRPHTVQTSRLKLITLRKSSTHIISKPTQEHSIEQLNSALEAFVEEPNSETGTEGFQVSQEDKIPVKQLWDYLRQAHLTDYGKLLQDYQQLPSGRLYDCIEASRADNSKKNRYRDIIPYDHSRVILQNDQANASTYINASYIDGYTQAKKFIASQGPTDAMVRDFWNMVLQQHSSIIVMLTNLIENGAKKCIQYWPDEGENRLFGEITVKTIKVTTFPDYVIRELDVCKQEEILTRVAQIHFTAWPDKAVPTTAWHLVNFWRKSTSLTGQKIAPVIVHCSAGVGRTGTFIALDNLYTQAKIEGYIQPFEIVKRMREQRMSMVQTEEQYNFLHEAIAEALYLGMKPLKPSEFAATFTSLLQTDTATGKTGLEEQFQWLNPGNVAEDGDPQYSNLLITKESEEYRPKRVQGKHSDQSGMELSYIQNFAGKVIFLVTKSPRANSVDQLHKLIAKHNIRTVINLSDSIQVHGDAQLSKNGGKGNAFNEISFSLNQESDHSTRTVKEFVFHAWKEESLVPKDTQSVIALLNAVQSWQPFVYEAQPILLHCNSGYVKSGLVCVLLAEFERIRIEEEANILETVKRIKERNPRMVQHYEQYKFCYLAVSDYIRQFDVYMNV